jgi:hypothetical protein
MICTKCTTTITKILERVHGTYRVSQIIPGRTVTVTPANGTLKIRNNADLKNPAKIVVRAGAGVGVDHPAATLEVAMARVRAQFTAVEGEMGAVGYRVSHIMTGWTVTETAANGTLNIWNIADLKNLAKIVVRAGARAGVDHRHRRRPRPRPVPSHPASTPEVALLAGAMGAVWYSVSQITPGRTVTVTPANGTLKIWNIADFKNPAKIVVRAGEGSCPRAWRKRRSALGPPPAAPAPATPHL